MASYSIFKQNTGASIAGPSSGVSYSSDICLGMHFYVTEGDCWLNGYWWWVQDGTNPNPTVPQDFVLWQVGITAPSVCYGSSVTSGTLAVGWNYIGLTTPIQLTPNVDYIAGTHLVGNFNDTFSYFGSGDPGNGASNGPLVAATFKNNPMWSGYDPGFDYTILQNGLYNTESNVLVDCPLAEDPDTDGWANYWIDVEISDEPPGGNNYTGSYRIWPSMPAAGSRTVDTPNNFNIATEFSLAEKCTLNNIWYFSPPGATQLCTEVAIWTLPGGSVSGTVVPGTDNASPVWTLPDGAPASAGDGWMYTPMGGSVTLESATPYKVSVYNGNASPEGSTLQWLGYYTSGSAGYGGFSQGPINMPDTAHANQAWIYGAGDGGATPPYSSGSLTAGQGTFSWTSASMTYPFL